MIQQNSQTDSTRGMRPATTTFTLHHMAMVVFPSSTRVVDNPAMSSGTSGSIDLFSTTTVAPPVVPVGDSKVDEGRGSFTASCMIEWSPASSQPLLSWTVVEEGTLHERLHGPKGLFERNFFGFDLRATGVFALTADASSVTASSFMIPARDNLARVFFSAVAHQCV